MSRPRHSARRKRSLKHGLWTAAILALLLLAAGCGNPGHPTAYDDTVQTNYINACTQQALNDRIVRDASEYQSVCGCAYARISREVSFEDFREFDAKVRGNPSLINEDETGLLIRQIMEDCKANSAGVA